MNKAALIVPALLFVIGAYLLISGITADGTLTLLGGRVSMASKFGILLGGIGIFAGVVIAFEMLGKKRSKASTKSAAAR